MARAMSSPSPMRPRGICRAHSRMASSLRVASREAERVPPGATPLTVMPSRPNSTAAPPRQGVDGTLGGAVVAEAVEVVAIGGQRRGEQDTPGGALTEVGVGVLHQPEARIDADVEDFLKFAVVGGQQRGI